MLMLRVTGYGAYGLGVIALAMLSYGWVFLGAAISLIAAGTLFLAADKVLQVLSEIRDRMPIAKPSEHPSDDSAVFKGPVRTAAEIDADLKRLGAVRS